MNIPEIDVLIPTARQPERFHNLLFQIRAVLNSPVNARVTVAMSGEWPELIHAIHPKEWDRVRIASECPDGQKGNPFHTEGGYMSGPKVAWCLDNLDWGDWWYFMGDDDCLLPWGLRHMLDASDGVDMVIGQVLGVSRKDHLDFTPYTIGRSIARCRVSSAGAMFRVEAMKKLDKPWWNPNSGYADWELIERMSKAYLHRITASTIHVLSLCELPQLPATIRPIIERFSAVKEAVPC